MCASSAVIALRPMMISLYRLSNCRARAPSYSSHRLLREPIAALGDLEQEGLRPQRPQSLCELARLFRAFAPMGHFVDGRRRFLGHRIPRGRSQGIRQSMVG
jgi:hypothetical protein